MGVKVRGGREVYAARACAGKYTPAPLPSTFIAYSKRAQPASHKQCVEGRGAPWDAAPK